MLMLIIYVAMAVCGISAILHGRIKLSGTAACEGPRARLAGIVLCLPFPVNFTLGFVIGLMSGERSIESMLGWLAAMEVAVTLVLVATAFGIALSGRQTRAAVA